jgi:hypothetical protein
MKKIIVLIFPLLVLLNISFGQTLDSLFDSFQVTNGWNKIINTNDSITTSYNKNVKAQITFEKKDRRFEIFVFNKNVLQDSVFLISEENLNAESSCRNYNTHSSYRISKFITEDFYIVPVLCPKCNFDTDKLCIKLAKSYSEWLMKNIK